PLWLDALLLAPLWLAAPWVYDRISQAIDRVWLRRPYGRVEAERQFVHAIQGADSEEMLHEQATRILSEIFQTKATVKGADISLQPRPDGVTFLSDELALKHALVRTIGDLPQNVR